MMRRFEFRDDVFHLCELCKQLGGSIIQLKNKFPCVMSTIMEWLDAIKSVRKEIWLRQVNPTLRKHIKKLVREISGTWERGDEYTQYKGKGPVFGDGWFQDPRLRGVCNHTTRGHIRLDLHRYLFTSAFAQLNKKSKQYCNEQVRYNYKRILLYILNVLTNFLPN